MDIQYWNNVSVFSWTKACPQLSSGFIHRLLWALGRDLYFFLARPLRTHVEYWTDIHSTRAFFLHGDRKRNSVLLDRPSAHEHVAATSRGALQTPATPPGPSDGARGVRRRGRSAWRWVKTYASCGGLQALGIRTRFVLDAATPRKLSAPAESHADRCEEIPDAPAPETASADHRSPRWTQAYAATSRGPRQGVRVPSNAWLDARRSGALPAGLAPKFELARERHAISRRTPSSRSVPPTGQTRTRAVLRVRKMRALHQGLRGVSQCTLRDTD
ncbi:hypothetical protein K438DRAFT_1749333 [Mycena galopus ATCC 62051]|nr:hypothetical protein K438DRAFT_1749333 [Mycena galopus ATCC 62051]